MPAPDGEATVLGIVDAGVWSATFGLCLTELQLSDAYGPRRIVRPGCGYLRERAHAMGVAEARNAITRMALATPAQWLLWLDTDMGFPATVLDELRDAADPAERPVMGALCFSLRTDRTTPAPYHASRYEIRPTMLRWAELPADPDSGRQAEAGFTPMMEYPRGAVVPVSATGAACLLVHRSALERVRDRYGERWFEPITHPTAGPGGTPRPFSEDISFCVRLQAVDVPVHVDTRVRTTHDKGGVFLDEVTFAQQMEFRAALARGDDA